jgi:phage-related protein
MPSIGLRCHELRIQDESRTWRIFYRLDADAIVIAEVAAKTTQKTPTAVLDAGKRRLARFDRDQQES